ncbi:MAG: tRNA (N(6)-L-threonylcarbamoyladenosine(37)-C(2))-methylthiotransferase MtaB [Paludibacteraceae bacterium]|nr:tRNA (N(6)-L-threonylcarbamoyladenosine(37)-C(2))-methylthiotransferase MtaB [Paludibacteraceae bacterium]
MEKHKKILFQTLGCKLNFAESSAIGKEFAQNGFEICDNGETPDVVIINTCSVTDTADKKGRQLIHRMVRNFPHAFIIVTGCYAQLKSDEIGGFEGVDMVLGANEKVNIADFITDIEKKNRAEVHVVRFGQIRNFKPECSADDRTRHFLKVQDGCDYFCTYCTIPFARGRSRNASIAETVKVAKQAIKEGAKEIVLTGVNTGDFGRSTGENFHGLIKTLDNIEAEVRYRISSIEPNLLTDEILETVAQSRHFAPHFHIPLQSGSNEVLELMKRRYTTEFFAEKIYHIKDIMPDAFIGVDVMTGCRGESRELFMKGKAFIESLPISQLHVFTYSERAKTKALEIKPIVPMHERRERTSILQEVSDRKLREFYESQRGKYGLVLWEESKDKKTMAGFTENYVRQTRKYDEGKINQFEQITIE